MKPSTLVAGVSLLATVAIAHPIATPGYAVVADDVIDNTKSRLVYGAEWIRDEDNEWPHGGHKEWTQGGDMASVVNNINTKPSTVAEQAKDDDVAAAAAPLPIMTAIGIPPQDQQISPIPEKLSEEIRETSDKDTKKTKKWQAEHTVDSGDAKEVDAVITGRAVDGADAEQARPVWEWEKVEEDAKKKWEAEHPPVARRADGGNAVEVDPQEELRRKKEAQRKEWAAERIIDTAV